MRRRRGRRWGRPGIGSAWLGIVLMACGGSAPAPGAAPVGGCAFAPVVVPGGPGGPAGRTGERGSVPDVRWTRPADPEARAELDLLCGEVGPPLVVRAASVEDAPPDELVVVAWNIHGKAGRPERLLDDLRSGRLTGTPVRHFVLLLQEVSRGAAGAPDSLGDLARLARRQGLDALYVPSIPGRWTSAGPGDRGNAVLSTLPLSDLEALELPVQRQRRVAVAATVGGRAADGTSWELRAVSVHLENRSRWRALHRSLGEDRGWQAARLVAALEGEERVVVGGDFNTWLGGRKEPAGRLMEGAFPPRCAAPEGGTIDIPLLPDMTLDHVFFRLPGRWWGRYEIVADPYGSDHKPLVATVAFQGPVRCARPGAKAEGTAGPPPPRARPPRADGIRPSRPARASRTPRP